jgi:hypothetical protein
MGCNCSKSVKKVSPIKTKSNGTESNSPNKARTASPIRRVIKKPLR